MDIYVDKTQKWVLFGITLTGAILMVFWGILGKTNNYILIGYSVIALLLTVLDINFFKLPIKEIAWAKSILLFISLILAIINLLFEKVTPYFSWWDMATIIALSFIIVSYGLRGFKKSYNIIEVIEILTLFPSNEIEAVCVQGGNYVKAILYKNEYGTIVDSTKRDTALTLYTQVFETKWNIREKLTR
ncbi:hypothetical protein [Bacillus sp. RIT694]|uniref:hypothetical protein n=1 Tax=Bacillus sp. RIT694 TaxID=2666190 RepID=UPI0012AC7EC0|nr:hypothetical protein [Bacillus sp. RIT694]MRS25594.1 hypothetical protein [Bacillus sp. RIT694]